jgi:hypothetical protein
MDFLHGNTGGLQQKLLKPLHDIINQNESIENEHKANRKIR